MVTSIIGFILLASFFFYYTSQRVELVTSLQLERWVQDNLQQGKMIGVGLLLVAMAFSIRSFGWTSGVLFWVLAVSAVLSYWIIIYPLHIIHYKHLLIVLPIALFIEFIL